MYSLLLFAENKHLHCHHSIPPSSFWSSFSRCCDDFWFEGHGAAAEGGSLVSFFFTKCIVQGSGMHFIMMIQLLSDHEQVNATASSLLQLTHPVFSFWLGSLNYISIALTILHQRTLKWVQRCSTWIMSSTLQYGGRCLKTKWLLKLLGTQLSIQSSPTLTQLHKDWLSGSTAIAPGYKEQLY